MRKQRCARPDFQRFRAAWLAHRNVPRVAEELGISPDDAGHWMKVFRFEGLDLPRNIVRPKKQRSQEGRGDIEASTLVTPPTSNGSDSQALLASEAHASLVMAQLDAGKSLQEAMFAADVATRDLRGHAIRASIPPKKPDPLADAKASILRDLASADDETVEKAFQRLGALERLKRL